MNHAKFQEIPIELLVEHPENSNFMNKESFQKLLRHIKQTGRYEPLTVRPYPGDAGKFQVINGHNRLRVLRTLEHHIANCVVWKLNDKQTRIYLATLNRLSGKDIPERRANLIGSLLQSFEIEELTALLPDNKNQIAQFEHLSHFETDIFFEQQVVGEKLFEIPIILDFKLNEPEAKELNLAIDLVIHSEQQDLSRSQALVFLARFYLNNIGFR
jgi:hypothetical protein